MSVMRVEKNSNYTVMANYHLRDKGISLKAKGLLSVMLSLPAEWDYTLAGLAHISKEGVDAIGTAVKELEYAGYVVRTRRRNEAGQLLDTEYTIYEFPQNKKTEEANANKHKPAPVTPIPEKPILENPVLDNPVQAIPSLEKPIREKAVQLNTEEKKKKEKNTDISNPYQSNIHPSIPETERPPQIDEEAELPCEQDEALIGLLNYQARSCGLTERQIYTSKPTKLPDMRKRLSYNELVRKVKDQIDYQAPSKNIAIYGHHISHSDAMFSMLMDYKDASYCVAHSLIRVSSLYGERTYRVFAVLNMNVSDWDAATASFSSNESFLRFVNRAIEKSMVDTGVRVTSEDNILTLITCDRSYGGASGRLIVMAVQE